MAKYLVTRCGSCGEPVEAVRVAHTPSSELGSLVQAAANNDRSLQIQEKVELGHCDCSTDAVVSEADALADATKVSAQHNSSKLGFRWTIRKFLYITAIVCLFLVVFRNPINHMVGVQNWAFVNSPWLVYRWLFFGIPMPPIQKGPPAGFDLILFCINVVLAVLVGFYVIRYALLAIRYGWKKVSS